MPVARTDGRSVGRSVVHLINKFSGMGRFIYPWCSAGALRVRNVHQHNLVVPCMCFHWRQLTLLNLYSFKSLMSFAAVISNCSSFAFRALKFAKLASMFLTEFSPCHLQGSRALRSGESTESYVPLHQSRTAWLFRRLILCDSAHQCLTLHWRSTRRR